MRLSAVPNNRMILMLGEPRSGTSEQARRHGLGEERFEMLPMIERFAWNWAILNEKAIEDWAAIDTVKVLRYHNIYERPIQEARALFRFTGLSWDQQTEDFTTFRGRNRFYLVFNGHLGLAGPLAQGTVAGRSAVDIGSGTQNDLPLSALSTTRCVLRNSSEPHPIA